jgi:hypothetical protein
VVPGPDISAGAKFCRASGIVIAITTTGEIMAKPNYQFEKRQRELEKKKKKAEKAQKKAGADVDPKEPGTEPPPPKEG